MKKSQILAALALAFALGVVAPVANTVVSGETYAADTRAAETASKQEVDEAVAKVENYNEYKLYKAVIDADNDYTNDTLSDGTTKLSAATPTSLAEAIASAVDAINDVNPSTTTYVDLDAAIAAAGRVKNYSAYNTLYQLMEQDNGKVTASALRSAILGIDNSNTVKNATKDMTVSELKNYVTNTWLLKDTYGEYVDLFDAVADASDYNDVTDRLETALNNVKEWNKNDDGKTAVDLAAEGDNPARALSVLANSDLPAFDKYETLATAIKNAKDTADSNGETINNQVLIDAINAALEAATAIVPGEKISLSDLSVPATTTPTNPDKPTTDEPKDPTAPDTGITAAAEGNASTTVAMVAGIATALTAAGAGVVAYRNARRSTRK